MAFKTEIKHFTASGTATITSGNTSVVVSLALPTSYSVVVTPDQNTGVYVTNKTTTGFQINIPSSLTSDVNIDYIIIE